MVKYRVISTAVLLLFLSAESAHADDSTAGQPSKQARKLLATLEKFGINSDEVKNFIGAADTHMDDKGRLHLTEKEALSGHISFNYDVHGGTANGKQFELRYAPKDYSNVNVVAKTNSIMLLYHRDFSYDSHKR